MYFRGFGPDAPGAEIRMDLPARKRDHDAIEERCVHGEDRRPRGTRVQAEGGPDIPAGHRAEIVVARLAVGCGTEQPAHPVDRVLGLPRLTDVVVQPRHPEAGSLPAHRYGSSGPTLSSFVKRSEPAWPLPCGRRGRSPGRRRYAAPTRRIARRCPRQSRPGRSPKRGSTNPGPSGEARLRCGARCNPSWD